MLVMQIKFKNVLSVCSCYIVNYTKIEPFEK